MNYKKKLAYIQQTLEVAALLENANVIDIKVTESDVTLREFVAGMLSYQPSWVTFMYRIRAGFVRLLGMKQGGIPRPKMMSPEKVPMEQGKRAYIFTVHSSQEDRFWMSEIKDSHLDAMLGVVVEPLSENQRRFYVLTLVYYNQWVGRLYFNVIRPFHHLVIRVMIKAATRHSKLLTSIPIKQNA
jgi:hypothetical protein